MIEHIAADALNAKEDLKEAADAPEKAAEAEEAYAAKANQLAALLWQVGGIDKIDIGSKDFKCALDEIRQRLEDRMTKAEADKKPKAAAAAAASDDAPPASGKDDGDDE